MIKGHDVDDTFMIVTILFLYSIIDEILSQINIFNFLLYLFSIWVSMFECYFPQAYIFYRLLVIFSYTRGTLFGTLSFSKPPLIYYYPLLTHFKPPCNILVVFLICVIMILFLP